jgi:hypothetical protein
MLGFCTVQVWHLPQILNKIRLSGSNSLILKTDTLGHVRTPVERQKALLPEFDRSGLPGKKFARLSSKQNPIRSRYSVWRPSFPGNCAIRCRVPPGNVR